MLYRPSDQIQEGQCRYACGVRSPADVAARLGVLVHRDFLDAGLCDDLRNEMLTAPTRPAPMYRASASGSRVEGSSNSRIVEIPSERRELIAERITGLRPRVAEHFGLPISRCTPPSFLTYRQGHFVEPHPDTKPEAADAEVRDRKITLVTFLNDQAEDPAEEEFAGGSLVLYGLLGPASARHGIPLTGERGMLVAFPATTLHEVRPVTAGERQTVVSWFL